MDETIIFPSPNWFQPSGIAVSTDEWLVYGGPTKSLCVLEPLSPENDTVIKGHQAYTAHVVNRAHPEKIVCVDLCPEWPEKRCALTGSFDGAVKQWSFEKTEKSLKIASTHSHEMHSNEKEEVIGVGYCKDGYAVTVGGFGHIVKWDLNSNVAKTFNHVLKNFKPVCMACSPHLHMHVAIGTKQGVLFVLDLNGYPRIVYKVRGQDDEIMKVSWCPQYEVAVRKALKEVENKRSPATQRLEKIRKEPESPETLKLLDERVQNSQTSEKPVKVNENSEPVIEANPSQEALDESGIGKTLPEDSFDESIVQEDDMFDIYKDHEADEFGHKKFQPVDIMVKIPMETVKDDYLVDCLKLKEEILKRKTQSDTTIGELVEAMDKTQLDAPEELASTSSTSKPDSPVEGKIIKVEMESSVHIHKHLLATISRQGSIRVWSKSGKLMGSCAVMSKDGGKGKGGGGKRGYVSTLVWATPELLLLGDGNNQILDCNPLKIDCKNKLQWKPIHHLHTRGLFAIAVNTPRVQAPSYRHEDVAIWSAAQDRCLVWYSLKTKESVTHMTCGGYIYTIKPCPYDARRVAVSAGDGNIRVWEADSLQDDESKLSTTRILNYWQNVMGKVLVTAWHPEKENLLAFATAESRVGLIECVGKEKPAKVLHPVLAGGVYALSWARGALLACGNGHVAQYDVDKLDQDPVLVEVSLEGARWEVSTVQWCPQYVAVGSNAGAVGVMTHDFTMIAAAFVFNKMIHTIDWHPQETTLSSEPSPYKNLIAVCSLAKVNTVIILEFGDEKDCPKGLTPWRTLQGHTDTVLQVAWSPHRDHQLLSTSQDGTVRIWDVSQGACSHIFGGHVSSAIGASWCAWPALPDHVLSGGGDSALRMWNTNLHPAEDFQAIKYDVSVNKKMKKKDLRREKEDKTNQQRREEEMGGGDAGAGRAAAPARNSQDAIEDDRPKRRFKKKFLLPNLDKQMTNCSVAAPRKMLQKHLQKNNGAGTVVTTQAGEEHGVAFINIFGNINEVNALLDGELERHEDTGGEEAWLVLNILRGNIDACVQRAAKRDAIDPFLLTIAPAVSFKYWKDVTLMYLQQMERLAAKGEESTLLEIPSYGGPVFRRVCAQLSLHDVKGAVAALQDAHLYKEAYVLSRTRYMDSLAEGTLRMWAQLNLVSCQWNLSAVCFIALGELAAAADALSKSFDEGSLSLAADIAKALGQHTFATHVEGKRDQLKHMRAQEQQANSQLKTLPNKADAILRRALEETDDDTNEASVIVKDDVKMVGEPKEVKDEAKKTKDDTKEVKDEAKEMKDEAKANEIKDDTKVIEGEPKEMRDEMKQVKDEAKEVKDGAKSLQDIANELEVLKNVSDDDKVINKTEELLKKLPEEMEGLMKEPSKVNAHAGDGDSVQNGHVQN